MKTKEKSPMIGALAGQVAKQLSIGVQTLHFYESEGLIPRPERSEAGYRLYTPELIERVVFIRKAQALGLPLGEIREIIELAAHGACPCGRVQAALQEKLEEIDRRLRELRGFRRNLSELIGQSEALTMRCDHATICPIVEDAPKKGPASGLRKHLMRGREASARRWR